ncbi:MAG: DUF3109 family protein [Phycisphaerales bacterium]|nr:DUF3109 family protein [Phycisphaerales bacterium]
MLVINNVLVSDEIIEEQFICNTSVCKGACCEQGDAGAPLTDEEVANIEIMAKKIYHTLAPEAQKILEAGQFAELDATYGWVTPTINKGLCVYGIKDNKTKQIHCMFEKAYNEGLIPWKKPISCHLYPIKITTSSDKQTVYMNYEPRADICKPGCALGKKNKKPVFQFLKEAIIRKYGEEFYTILESYYLQK